MSELIAQAIREKRLLSFRYKNRSRVVEPYTLGLGKDGKVMLSAWHVSGFSDSKAKPDWRLFTVYILRDVEMLDDRFEVARDGYNPENSRMRRILERFQSHPTNLEEET